MVEKRLNEFRVKHTFVSMDDQFSFDELASTMLIDFDVKELVDNESPLVVTELMKGIYKRVSRDLLPFTKVLTGPSGIGKTSTLVVIGHLVRKSGGLVFPLQARDLMTCHSVPRWVDSFLKRWKRASGNAILESTIIKETQNLSLLALVNSCIQDNDQVKIQSFLDLATSLKDLTSVPVLFLIDQFNVLDVKSNPESLESLPEHGRASIAKYFAGWNEFKLARGAVIFAATASFASMEDAWDGNSSCIALLPPMNADPFRRLVEMMIAERLLPDTADMNIDELYTYCGGVPRELRSIADIYRAEGPADWKRVLSANSDKRYDFYSHRVTRLMKSEKTDDLQKGSYELACTVLLGGDVKQVPRQWRDCGLIIRKDLGFRIVCPAAERAVIEFFNPDKLRTALHIYASNPFTSWRILELSFVYLLRLSIYCSRPVEFRCTDLSGQNPQTLSICIDKIQHYESSPPAASVRRGTLAVLPRNQKIVDLMIHDADGQVFFIKISESCYTDHDSKLDDSAKEYLTGQAKSALNSNGKLWKYLYVTTSKSLICTNDWTRSFNFEVSVLLLSNAAGATDVFFRNGLTSKFT